MSNAEAAPDFNIYLFAKQKPNCIEATQITNKQYNTKGVFIAEKPF
jgi:hypothetical protein